MDDETKNIVEKGYSVRSGAYAVFDENITMELDEYGEYAPIMKEFSDLGLVCAMSSKSLNETELGRALFGNSKDIKYDQTLGYYLDLYAGHVLEGTFRRDASSGGLATWIFKELLKNKLIDGVIHVKESKSGDVLFDYDISRTVQEICDGAKTKYYPVEFSHVLKEIKQTKGRYAIIGIPSFITEIRLLAQQDKIIADRIKYTLGLICGHQKSTKYAEALAWQQGFKPGSLKAINFRKKIPNKSANNYATEMTGIINGDEVTKVVSQDDLFVSNWGHGFFKTKFSDFTDDAMNETADVSLGDAWLPEYTADGLGNNVLIVRNREIADIIKQGIKDKKVKLDVLGASDIIRSQSGLVHHTRDELPYRLYKKDANNVWRPTKRVVASNNLSYLRKKVQDTRESIARQSHIVYKEAVYRDDWSYFEDTMSTYVRRYNRLYTLISFRRMGPAVVTKKVVNKVKRKLSI